MKVVIVGAGYTGIQLTKSLSDEKADVVLVDNSPERVRIAATPICKTLTLTVVRGEAFGVKP